MGEGRISVKNKDIKKSTLRFVNPSGVLRRISIVNGSEKVLRVFVIMMIELIL